MIQIRTIAATAAALAVTAAVHPAAGQAFAVREGVSTDPSRSVAYVRLSYADLDLTSAVGVRTLLQRIEAAADAVCGVATAVAAPQRADAEACRAEAISGAVARTNSPALAALAAPPRSDLRASR